MRYANLTALLAGAAVGALAAPVLAGAHTWDVVEVFSNASGSVMFIELKECCGGAAETAVGGHAVTSLDMGSSYIIPANVVGPTGMKRLLFATQKFADLFGAPTPNYIIGQDFFDITGDTVTYVPYDSWVFGAVPTNGTQSLNRTGGVLTMTPTNYAGATASLDVNCLVADLDHNGNVGFNDLTTLLLNWGPCPPACPWDIDESGDVGFADLTAILLQWGAC